MSRYLLDSTSTGESFFVIPERLSSIRSVVMAFTANKQTNKRSQLYISRGSLPSASFNCYGAPLTTFLRGHFDDGASTKDNSGIYHDAGTILVIAFDMVNRMPIPGLMECKASDYAESHSSK